MPCGLALQTPEGFCFDAHWITTTRQRNNRHPDDMLRIAVLSLAHQVLTVSSSTEKQHYRPLGTLVAIWSIRQIISLAL